MKNTPVSALAMIAATAVVATAFAAGAATASTQQMNPAADTYVNSKSPDKTFGAGTTLETNQAAPIERAYLRFGPIYLNDPLVSATLRVYVQTTTRNGFQIAGVDDETWSESTMKYSNAPAPGAVVVRSGPTKQNTWVSLDVTTAVHSGLNSFAVVDADSARLRMASRESTNKPQLILTFDTTPTSPTPSPSASTSPSPDPSAPASISPSPSAAPSESSSPSPSAPTTASPSTSSAPATSGVVTDPTKVFTEPSLAKPGYLGSYTDPVFGTRVTRLAGDPSTSIAFTSGGSGTWGSDVRQHFSDDQDWNADDSLIWIQNRDGGTPSRIVLDGTTYKPKFPRCSNYDYRDDRWHPSLDHKTERINVKGALLSWFDVTLCTQTRSWALPFTSEMDISSSPSRDGRWIALGDSTRVYVVDMDPQSPYAAYPNKRVGPTYDATTGCGLTDCTIHHITISPSGKYVMIHYAGDHDRVLDVNATTLALTPRVYPAGTPECSGHDPAKGYIFDVGHPDRTFDPFANNEDVIVGQNRSWCPQTLGGQALGRIYSVRLSDGVVKSLTPAGTAQAYHISCRDSGRPGWCFSSFWPSAGKTFSDEIVAFKLDGSGTVERWVHTHTDTTNCYRCEAHPVPSRDGLRLLFASSWTADCTTCGSQTNPQVYLVDTRGLRSSFQPAKPITRRSRMPRWA